MKKIIAIVMLFIMAAVLLAGCAAEVSREAIDVRYTEPFDRLETDYVYKYNWFGKGFQLVPEVKMVHHDAKYEIRYLVTYDNGSKTTEWCEVSECQYNLVKSELMEGEE